MSTRQKDLRDIAALYGTDTPEGREMLETIIAKYALALLPDEAIRELADMHRAADARGA
jgi:DNA-binding FadR family transcriptional regulator